MCISGLPVLLELLDQIIFPLSQISTYQGYNSPTLVYNKEEVNGAHTRYMRLLTTGLKGILCKEEERLPHESAEVLHFY